MVAGKGLFFKSPKYGYDLDYYDSMIVLLKNNLRKIYVNKLNELKMHVCSGCPASIAADVAAAAIVTMCYGCPAKSF